MEVVGAGFGRTGTLSLKVALEKLGFSPCYHMVELPKHPGHGTFWKKAMRKKERGEPIEWKEVFGNYRATVDFPAANFYAELAQASSAETSPQCLGPGLQGLAQPRRIRLEKPGESRMVPVLTD